MTETVNRFAKAFHRLIMSLKFEPGDCDICRQKDVKVRTLLCNKHYYCMMCAEFVPRFLSGNISCQKCPVERTQVHKKREDCFPATRTNRRTRRGKLLPVSKFEKLMDFDDSEDDDDLEGNNQEWDQLLESLTKPATPVKSPLLQEEPAKSYPRLIPRKPSFLHLTLPSAHDDVTDQPESPNANLISNTVTQLLNSPHGNKLPDIQSRSTSASSSDSQLNPLASSQNEINSEHLFSVPFDKAYSDSKFEIDPSELERNTSPCKGVRPRSCQSWYSESPCQGGSPVSESEEIMESIGEIKGPDFLSSSSSRSGSDTSLGLATTSKSYDDFWDSKIG